jgi:hypothetical protein
MKKGIIISLAILLYSCSSNHSELQKELRELGAKVKVNEKIITAHDIRLMQSADSCYGAYIDSVQALIKLINIELESEILHLCFNKPIKEDTLKQKSAWVDANTRAPNILNCVKAKYGKDTSAYLQWYILPTVVNPVLHKLYNFSKEIHRNVYQRMADIRDSLDKGLKRLEQFAEYKKWDIPKGKNYEWLPFVQEVVIPLKEKETYKGIYEDDYWLSIPRKVKETEENWYLDGITLDKEPFEKWFSQQVKEKVKIEWLNEKEKELIRQRYPEWWEKMMP